MSLKSYKSLLPIGALFVLAGFVVSTSSRTGSPAVSVADKINAWQYATGMRQALAIMDNYGDLLEQGKATEQDWQSCLRTEAEARAFIKEVLESNDQLKLPAALDAQAQIKDINPCPAPDMFERMGARAFQIKHAL